MFRGGCRRGGQESATVMEPYNSSIDRPYDIGFPRWLETIVQCGRREVVHSRRRRPALAPPRLAGQGRYRVGMLLSQPVSQRRCSIGSNAAPEVLPSCNRSATVIYKVIIGRNQGAGALPR
ncbi:unnamed protein product [Phaeothamnion confervicola]